MDLCKRVLKKNQLIYFEKFITANLNVNANHSIKDDFTDLSRKDDELLVIIEFDHLAASNMYKNYFPVLTKNEHEVIIAPFTFFYITDITEAGAI